MKALTIRQIIRILEAHNFQVSRQRGSHVIYKHSQTGQIVPVLLHAGNSPLPIRTFVAIGKQSGLDPKDFSRS